MPKNIKISSALFSFRWSPSLISIRFLTRRSPLLYTCNRCAIVSAAVVWFAYPIMVDTATAHKRRSMALRQAPRAAKDGDTPSHPDGGGNGVSAGADANGSTSKSPNSTALPTETPLLQSLLAFMSDTVIMVQKYFRHRLGPFLMPFSALTPHHPHAAREVPCLVPMRVGC